MTRTVGAIAAAVATFASAIGLVTTGGWLISMAALGPPLLTLQVAIVSVRAFGIARGSFRWVERVISHDAALHDTVERRARLWVSLAKAGPRGAWTLRVGDAITRLMQDAEVMQDRITRVIVPASAAVITGLGAMTLQWRFSAAAGAAFLGALILAGAVVPLLTMRIESLTVERALLERAELNAALAEFTTHVDELRILGVSEQVIEDIATIDARRMRVEMRGSSLAALTQLLALLASGAAIWAALSVAVPAVLEGRLPGPDLAVVALLPWSAAESVSALSMAASAAVRVRAATRRLASIEQLAPEVPPLQAGASDTLTVQDLGVRWGDDPALSEINFSVAPGERIAIVGPSGAGKSSLVAALLGLIEYTGSIVVAGSLVARPRAQVITAVPQRPHAFATTIRENLRLAAGDVEDEYLRAALDAVQLHELALDRDLSAAPISGGELLRLGVARALLVPAPFVILDEPVEHLDEATAGHVMATVKAAVQSRGLILTTHRLEDLRDFHRIVILDAGRITCVGTFEECLTGSVWFQSSVHWRLEKRHVA